MLIVSTIYRTRTILGLMSLAGIGSRYFYPAQLIVLWLLLAACADGVRRARLVAILLGLSLIANFPDSENRHCPTCTGRSTPGKSDGVRLS